MKISSNKCQLVRDWLLGIWVAHIYVNCNLSTQSNFDNRNPVWLSNGCKAGGDSMVHCSSIQRTCNISKSTPQHRLASPLRKPGEKQSSMNHLFWGKPLPAKWLQKKKKKEYNLGQPVLKSHSNKKQSGWSVAGYARLSTEIWIKACWHLKSSITRQPIWVKTAPCWLSYVRPTPETGVIQANKAAGESRHLFWRRDRNISQQRQDGDQVALGSRVYTARAVCMCVICSGKADTCLTQTWAVAFDPQETAKELTAATLPV